MTKKNTKSKPKAKAPATAQPKAKNKKATAQPKAKAAKAKATNAKAKAPAKAKGTAKAKTPIPVPIPAPQVKAPATAYPDVDVTVLRGRQDLIPRKYVEQRLNAWSTQEEKLQFHWDLGYRKVSREIFSEIEFSETAPIQLSSSGADYGKFKLMKEIHEQDFNLVCVVGQV